MTLQGKWRIIETALWDRDYLDLVEPAFILIEARGEGEMAYGALTAALAVAIDETTLSFTWNGADEGDQVSGDGWAELDEEGALVGEISYHNGDETTFKAIRWPTSSTAC